MKTVFYTLIATAALFMTACSDKKEDLAPEMDSSQFVLISDVVPDVIQEIRYYSTYNFIGGTALRTKAKRKAVYCGYFRSQCRRNSRHNIHSIKRHEFFSICCYIRQFRTVFGD